VTEDELRTAFARGWRVDAIEPATIESRSDRYPVQAWLATITRVDAAGQMA
jgi:hypothetical protein